MRQLFDDIGIVSKQLTRWVWGLLLVLPLFYLLSGFYSVSVDQRAYVTRFGKLVQDNITSGMHYHLPWPIESVSVKDIPSLKSKVIEFTIQAPKLEEIELITGDGNLVDSQVEVQYSVTETMKFSTVSEETDLLVEDLVKSAVIFHISHHVFENLLTTGRNRFQDKIKSKLQDSADGLRLGIRITGLQIKRLEPPKSIKKAFDDLSSAQSEKQKSIQEAKGERGARLSRARSESNSERSNANAFTNELIKRAEGDVERFESLLAAMSDSDDLYIKRAYYINLEKILKQSKVTLISPGRSTQN